MSSPRSSVRRSSPIPRQGISKGVPADQRHETVQGHVRKLVDAGAERVEILDEHGDYWVVLRDVEGNEFCVQ